MVEDNQTEERAGAAWDKTKGKTNEVVGAARGDLGQELKGKAQGAKGNLREGIQDLKEDREERR